MTRKNFKKDWLNLKEVSDSSRSVEVPKFKLDKSRTESLMLFAPLRLPLLKELSLEGEQLFSMLPKNSINCWKTAKT